MKFGVEQRGSVVSYRSIVRTSGIQSESMWKTNRHGVDERMPKFPDVRDPIFDGGAFPGFDKQG